GDAGEVRRNVGVVQAAAAGEVADERLALRGTVGGAGPGAAPTAARPGRIEPGRGAADIEGRLFPGHELRRANRPLMVRTRMRARLCFLVGGLTLTLGCHRGGIQGLTPVLSSARVYYDDGRVPRHGAQGRTRSAHVED